MSRIAIAGEIRQLGYVGLGNTGAVVARGLLRQHASRLDELRSQEKSQCYPGSEAVPVKA